MSYRFPDEREESRLVGRIGEREVRRDTLGRFTRSIPSPIISESNIPAHPVFRDREPNIASIISNPEVPDSTREMAESLMESWSNSIPELHETVLATSFDIMRERFRTSHKKLNKKEKIQCENPSCDYNNNKSNLYRVIIKAVLFPKGRESVWCSDCISKDDGKLLKVFFEKSHKKSSISKNKNPYTYIRSSTTREVVATQNRENILNNARRTR